MNNIGPVTITTPGDRQIVVTRLFDAPRALVFEAWTKAEHVAHWWDPSGLPLAVCEIDLRLGGAFRWVNRAPDGGEGYAIECASKQERDAMLQMRVDAGTAKTLENLAAYLPQIA